MDLRQAVRDAVLKLIDNRQPFTNVDISHPLIQQDPTIRHRDVRKLIDELWADGTIGNEEYTVSTITVYPSPNKGVAARLFHPDDPQFDPNTYTATHQELVRPTTPAAQPDPASVLSPVRTQGFSITDKDGDDGSNDPPALVTATVSGAKVTAQCEVQQKETTVNVPRLLIKNAGWDAGTSISIKLAGGAIQIHKAPTDGDQRVDNEGRIRLHGSNVSALGKAHGQPVQALLVQPNSGDSYIQIQ